MNSKESEGLNKVSITMPSESCSIRYSNSYPWQRPESLLRLFKWSQEGVQIKSSESANCATGTESTQMVRIATSSMQFGAPRMNCLSVYVPGFVKLKSRLSEPAIQRVGDNIKPRLLPLCRM